MTVILKDTDRGNEREFDTVEEAKDRKQELIAVGADKDDLEIVEEDSSEQTNAEPTERVAQTHSVETVESTDEGTNPTATGTDVSERQQDTEALHRQNLAQHIPVSADDLQDPLATLSDWMIDHIQSGGKETPHLNKRGCQVIAEYLGLEETDKEAIKTAGETDFEYATYRVEMTKPDGRSFTGYGTARADESDQGEDAGWKLNMLASTRAYKRAVKAATGGGIEAFAEAQL